MADITQLPTKTSFQWETVDAPRPRLSRSLGVTDTTIYWTSPPLNEDGEIISKAFICGVKNNNYTLLVYVPANAVQGYGNVPDSTNKGLSATSVVQGISLTGLDWTTGNSDNIPSAGMPIDSAIGCAITGFDFESIQAALSGDIATGGTVLKVGNETEVTAYIEIDEGRVNNVKFGEIAGVPTIWTTDGSSFTPGAGVGTISGGEGIDLTASVISVDRADTDVFKAISAGAGDAGKALLLDADGYVDSDSVQVLKDITANASEINQALDGITVDVTDTNLNTLTQGTTSDADALHTHDSLSIDTSIEAVSGSTTTLAEANTERTVTGATPTKIKEIAVELGGEFTCTALVKTSGGSEVRGQIYINGSPVGSESGPTGSVTTYQNWSQTITGISKGDLIQFYLRCTGASTVYGKDFQLKFSSLKPKTTVNQD